VNALIGPPSKKNAKFGEWSLRERERKKRTAGASPKFQAILHVFLSNKRLELRSYLYVRLTCNRTNARPFLALRPPARFVVQDLLSCIVTCLTMEVRASCPQRCQTGNRRPSLMPHTKWTCTFPFILVQCTPYKPVQCVCLCLRRSGGYLQS
jgi:hypothetical protein